MLLVIGDSHAVIWGGRLVLEHEDTSSLLPNIIVQYLGPSLAYNLVTETEGVFMPGKWGIEVLKHVRHRPEATAVCLCLGEIDLRTWAVKIAIERGITVAESVARIADRVVAFCALLRKECAHPIFFAAPTPTPHGRSWNTVFPSYGSEAERNAATWMFADYLSAKSRESKSFHVISIFDRLVDSNLKARSEFFADQVHLNFKGLDLLIGEFRRIVREQNLPVTDYWPAGLPGGTIPSDVSSETAPKVDPTALLGDLTVRDISKEIALRVDAKGPLNAILIDLGYGTFPHRLQLYLRFEEPRLAIALGGGTDASAMAPLGTYEAVSGSQPSFEVGFPDRYSCRYLEIAIDSSVRVAVDDIKVDVKSFLRP